MSQLQVRLMVDEFPYNEINSWFEEEQLDNFQKWIYKGHHTNINKNMTSQLNSEWIIRNYLSSKMILSATVMLTSLDYAIEKNLKMTIPYLSYYSVITCCRALLYTIPYNIWTNNDSFLNMTHSNIINRIGDYLNKLDKDFSTRIKEMIKELKQWRELFSYKFPSSGTEVEGKYGFYEIVDICTILCELAQFSSEQIQKYVSKKCMYNIEEWIGTEPDILEHGYSYDGIIDKEDFYRISYLRRKQPLPVSIYYTLTEGMVEDYFGTWYQDDDDSDIYNPDLNWRIIFPVP